MSTTTAPAQPAVTPATRRYDERAVRLGVLVRALDGVGLTGALAGTRELLAQAQAVGAELRADHVRARAQRDDLVARVAAGALSLADATTQLGQLALWLATRDDGPTPAQALAERVTQQLHEWALQAARADGLDAHAELSRLAAGAVKRGAAAGGKLIDVAAVVAALAPPGRRDDMVQTSPNPRDPMPDRVPLARLALEDIERNPARLALWGEASAALADLTKIHEVAELLHGITGGSSTLFGSTVDSDQRYRVTRDLAEPLRLTVFDALGWKPGLHLSLRPGRRPPGDDGTEVHNGIRYPRGWAAGLVRPRVGPQGR